MLSFLFIGLFDVIGFLWNESGSDSMAIEKAQRSKRVPRLISPVYATTILVDAASWSEQRRILFSSNHR